MNKLELIETLKEETGFTKDKAKQVVDLMFDQMTEALAAGDRVEVRGLCSFYVKTYKGYTGRSPKTQQSFQVPPKKRPFFRCGKELKERVDYKGDYE